jgi:hypothetical protein
MGEKEMNAVSYLEYALILLLIYILVRSSARNYFSDRSNRGTSLAIILIGIVILTYINGTIGVITILAGVVLAVIPEKKDGTEIEEKT